MGRKNKTKGKEKRLARKEVQLRLSSAKSVVQKANQLSDPLEPFSVFRTYKKNDIEATLCIKRVTELDEGVREWIFGLTKENMQSKYNACIWGWNDDNKREELMDEAAWYLIARSSIDDSLLGFSHFRFDLDEGIEVLYCYELQLERSVRRKGLGKFMMQILELVAFKNHMRKVVLTILKYNEGSDFFRAINYKLDETSPIDDDDKMYPYEILSKVNIKLEAIDPILSTPNNHTHSDCCLGHHHH